MREQLGKLGARAAKSLFFWSLTGILGFSAYTDILKISGAHAPGTENVQVSGMPEAETVEMSGIPEAENIEVPGNTEEKNVQVSDGQDPGNVQAADAPGTGDTQAADGAERRLAALTFDDGPHPVYTKKLLDGLAERNVQATFFVVGENIPGNEELIARMNEEGHLIGNHTYDHVKICDMSGESACEQVEKTSSLVREITGKETEFARPPFGAWNPDMECSFVMIPVLWDVDPLDWTTRNTDLIVQRVLEEVEDGDIILLHDYYDSSVEAAFRIIDELQEQGYEFVTVDKLILE